MTGLIGGRRGREIPALAVAYDLRRHLAVRGSGRLGEGGVTVPGLGTSGGEQLHDVAGREMWILTLARKPLGSPTRKRMPSSPSRLTSNGLRLSVRLATRGTVVSTVKARVATFGSSLPYASIAVTWNVCSFTQTFVSLR